ncbi:MAG: ABC transporter ATP-binding protein/permease [Candidatus Dormibacteraeota bacterium]|nr:ABC transporter ATP-binding protein/permease [Candidatus Dormibacteraeota bacterium]
MTDQLYRRFLPLLRPYRGRLAVAFAATLARPALNAARIWLLKVLIDDVLRGHQAGLLLVVCAGYLGIALGRGIASFADDYLGGWVGARVVRDLRTSLYDHLQGLSLRFFHRQRLGDLLTRLTGDIAAIEDLLVSGIADLVAHSLTIVLFLGMLLYLDPPLALVSLAILPALAVSSVVYARRTRSAQLAVREWASALTSVAEEGLSAIALVKAFARESFECGRFGTAAEGSLSARLQSIRLRALYTPLIDILATVGTVLVVWFGSEAVWSGRLSLGGLVVFLGYLGALYTPIQSLSRLMGVVQRARVGAERVAEVLDAEPVLQERRTQRAMGPACGLVEFRAVSFGYSPEHAVLRGFDLSIRPGETVALVGASGAGKTTVVSLLLNYYDADTGVLTIDDHDVRQFDPRSVRGQIAAVLQEPMLFQASVRENLRYGRLDASDDEIEEAARAAEADAFIRDLPDGYNTPVGPRGARLSGGQRQRLAIARALLKNAPILVLDEATSALDPVTEASVLATLRTRNAGRSVLIVAHRLSTIRHADRMVVLDQGRVVQSGTHAQLVTLAGPYRGLYEAQAVPLLPARTG